MTTSGRILTMGKNCAVMNMALDEAILRSQKPHPNPTLRFYDWTTPAFSFGYFQDIASEVDVDACRAAGIELVKRMTGGGTVVHGWDLTYTLILPRSAGELTVSDAYRRIGQSLVAAIERLGVSAECHTARTDASQIPQNICLTHPAQHDVMRNDKKVAGVSVRRSRDGIMFQGYISLDMPPSSILAHVSKHPGVQQMVREKSTAINAEQPYLKAPAVKRVTRDALIRAICETFDLGITFQSGNLSVTERAQAERLADTKYATSAWNFSA